MLFSMASRVVITVVVFALALMGMFTPRPRQAHRRLLAREQLITSHVLVDEP